VALCEREGKQHVCGCFVDRVGPGGGHHGIPGHNGLPREQGYIQVHHFKWTDSVVARLRRRVRRYETGRWELVNPSVVDEARRVLDYLDKYGRFDITDERLLIGACGDGYDGYRRWAEVAADAQRWQWIFA
jgi:hypothetical protein